MLRCPRFHTLFVLRPSGGLPLGTVLIIVLALVWAAVLLPSLVRSRLKSSPIDGVRSFEQAMGILAGTRTNRRKEQPSGRWIMVPRSDVTAPVRRRARVIRRRRRNFQRLLLAALATLGLAFVPDLRWMIFVHTAADLVLAGYVWRLRRWKIDEESRKAIETAPLALAPEGDRELARKIG